MLLRLLQLVAPQVVVIAPAALKTALPPPLAAPPAAAVGNKAASNQVAVATAAAAAPSVNSLGIPNLTSKKEPGLLDPGSRRARGAFRLFVPRPLGR